MHVVQAFFESKVVDKSPATPTATSMKEVCVILPLHTLEV